MTKEEHIEIHKDLHRSLDMLLADYLKYTTDSLFTTPIIKLMEWSYEQTIDPEVPK